MEEKQTPLNEQDAAVESAADTISHALSAATETDRAHIVDELNQNLHKEGVVVVDIEPSSNDRRGVRTGVTREQLLDELAIHRQTRAMRAARRVGWRALY